MKAQYWGGALIVALLVVGFVFWPVIRATQKYDAVGADSAARCEAALQAAEAWAELGFSGKYKEWQEQATLPCFSSSVLKP